MFISMEGKTVVVQLQKGCRIFKINCINPWIESELYNTTDSTPPTLPGYKEENQVYAMKVEEEEDVDLGDEPRNIKVKKWSIEERGFSKSRKD